MTSRASACFVVVVGHAGELTPRQRCQGDSTAHRCPWARCELPGACHSRSLSHILILRQTPLIALVRFKLYRSRGSALINVRSIASSNAHQGHGHLDGRLRIHSYNWWHRRRLHRADNIHERESYHQARTNQVADSTRRRSTTACLRSRTTHMQARPAVTQRTSGS